jgi:HSP20 family protein
MAQPLATRKNQAGSLAPRGQHQPVSLLRRQFDDLFERMWSGMLGPLGQDVEDIRVWDFDVQEKDKEITVRAEMPGFEESEINVELNNDVLIIRAEKQQKRDGEQEYRTFYRSVSLPSGINPEQAQATYRNGVLELHLPRTEGSQAKRITIQGQQTGTGQQAAGNKAGTAASQKAKT